MPSPDLTDRGLLADAAYRDDRHLAARQAIYRWQTPRYDLPGIIVGELPAAIRLVVDVGCGNGNFIRRIRADRADVATVGLDISTGILHGVAPPVAVADAQHLPLGDAVADAVLAMHMLYHVGDIDAGIAELRRVLRNDGVAIASTNSEHDKAELEQLWSRAAADVLGTDEGPRRVSLSNRFCLEAAPRLLKRHFQQVRTIELPGTINLTDPAPIVAHLASYEAWAAQMGVPFAETVTRAADISRRHIEEHGRFKITCLGGVLICYGPRGEVEVRPTRSSAAGQLGLCIPGTS